MSNLSTSYLVVGVDGSPPADEALAFALAEAARCGDEVRVVTSWHREPITTGLPMIPIPVPPDDTELRSFAEEAQAQALSRALADGNAPVALTCSVVQGEPGPALVDASRGARLLVVGSRALGPVRAALLGSVSRYVARHATCPVAVVPGRHPQERSHADRRPAAVGAAR